MSIPFQELDDSPKEHYGPKGVSATRRILILAENKTAMINKLLGDGYEFGGQLAAQYPGDANVEVAEIDVEPFHGTPAGGAFSDVENELADYTGKLLLLTIAYQPVPAIEWEKPEIKDLPKGTYFTYELDATMEHVQLPGWALHWEDLPNEPVDIDKASAVQDRAVSVHKLTFHRVVNPPFWAMRMLAGCVNAETFWDAFPETMRYDGAKATKEFAGFDDFNRPQYYWKIEYTFTERLCNQVISTSDGKIVINGEADPIGWNHFYRSTGNDPKWVRLLDTDDHTRYNRTDLSALFAFSMEPSEQK